MSRTRKHFRFSSGGSYFPHELFNLKTVHTKRWTAKRYRTDTSFAYLDLIGACWKPIEVTTDMKQINYLFQGDNFDDALRFIIIRRTNFTHI